MIAPDRVGSLFTLLDGHAGDDVLDLLATYHDQHGGQINDLLRGSSGRRYVQQLAQLTHPISQGIAVPVPVELHRNCR